MGNNVTIPLPLLKNLVVLLEYWDVSLFDRVIRDDYWDALWALKMKLLRLEIRDAYAMILNAPNEDARHRARIEYLRLKNQLVSSVANSAY
ncbi:MAG: hypothetical protein FWE20_12155 [Defluviitaleaceae bacterium]|nr:hypothetical protein [Defluviitaleaceae bacterium]